MRMLKPSPGEVVDRLSILALKIEHSKQPIHPAFEEEYEALVIYLSETYQDKLIPVKLKQAVDLSAELTKVNTRLWSLEDERRVLLKADRMDVIEVAENAKQTTVLNDIRAKLVQQINEVHGVNAPEKLYA